MGAGWMAVVAETQTWSPWNHLWSQRTGQSRSSPASQRWPRWRQPKPNNANVEHFINGSRMHADWWHSKINICVSWTRLIARSTGNSNIEFASFLIMTSLIQPHEPLCLFVQLASNIACSIWFSVNPGWTGKKLVFQLYVPATLTWMKYLKVYQPPWYLRLILDFLSCSKLSTKAIGMHLSPSSMA